MIKKIILFVVTASLLSCSTHKKGISLEKLVFHTSVCFGSCPVYHLQVNNDRSLLLHKEQTQQRKRMAGSPSDSLKSGYFTGTVSDTTFKKLIKELQNIGLDTLQFNGPDCCDGSEKTIIVYYNGKRKFLRAMFPPQSAQKLIATLYEVCETSPMQKTEKSFDIENEPHK